MKSEILISDLKITVEPLIGRFSGPAFKLRTFRILNLIAIWVDPNDVSSTVDWDVELNAILPREIYPLLIFTMHSGLHCLPVENKLH